MIAFLDRPEARGPSRNQPAHAGLHASGPVFWLRTVRSAGRTGRSAAFPPGLAGSGDRRTTNVHHSGASAADSHRLPNVALTRDGLRSRPKALAIYTELPAYAIKRTETDKLSRPRRRNIPKKGKRAPRGGRGKPRKYTRFPSFAINIRAKAYSAQQKAKRGAKCSQNCTTDTRAPCKNCTRYAGSVLNRLCQREISVKMWTRL